MPELWVLIGILGLTNAVSTLYIWRLRRKLRRQWTYPTLSPAAETAGEIPHIPEPLYQVVRDGQIIYDSRDHRAKDPLVKLRFAKALRQAHRREGGNAELFVDGVNRH